MYGKPPALLVALAILLPAILPAGCASGRGAAAKASGKASAGWLFPASRSDADDLCQRELPFDMIYPAGSPLAKGKSSEEQREAHYRKCMAIRGYADEPAG